MNKVQAQLAAKQLRARLQEHYGPGWTIRVWENLGWHFEADYGFLQVYPSHSQDTFWTLLGEHGGYSLWTDSFCSADPVEAVEHQLKLAQDAIANLTEMLRSSWPGKETW